MSIMSQYTPYGNLEGYLELNRKLKPLEYKIVLNAVEKCGLENVFIQDISSSSEEYIPEFYGEKTNL